MSLVELDTLLKTICVQNGMYANRKQPCGGWLPMVKYVSPNIDTRTQTCHSIVFRQGTGGEVVFHTQNECSDLPESLFERVNAWLKTPVHPTEKSNV